MGSFRNIFLLSPGPSGTYCTTVTFVCRASLPRLASRRRCHCRYHKNVAFPDPFAMASGTEPHNTVYSNRCSTIHKRSRGRAAHVACLLRRKRWRGKEWRERSYRFPRTGWCCQPSCSENVSQCIRVSALIFYVVNRYSSSKSVACIVLLSCHQCLTL